MPIGHVSTQTFTYKLKFIVKSQLRQFVFYIIHVLQFISQIWHINPLILAYLYFPLLQIETQSKLSYISEELHEVQLLGLF